ncbi:hypothetical protein ACHHYP_15426 [Achlya hypogyna]|uniref:WW domain-containing protein n=1 Tax=Achlya hypogyna TaxID=1202772 RepID=A0A1V9ZFD3_ACHHY|nr:hypothetical protein ACHHYP_15426 [Achlya hypogyna]
MAGRKRLGPSEAPSSQEDIAWVAGLAKQQEVNMDDIMLQRPSFVNDTIAILRNQSNPIIARAMAARTLGLLMDRDAGLKRQLKLDSNVLVDALLQIVNHCRHTKSSSTDLRKIHVNCCLVISMLMEAPYGSTSGLGHVVSLNSELLVLAAPPKAMKRKAPEVPTSPLPSSSPSPSPNQQDDRIAQSTSAKDGRRPRSVLPRSRTKSRHTPMRSVLFGSEGAMVGLTATGEDLPLYEFDHRFAGYGVPQVFYPFQRPSSRLPDAPPRTTSAMRPRTYQKPSRAVKGSKLTTALAVTPNLVMPSKLFEESLPPGRRPFLLQPDHMLEIFASNQMPISLPFSHHSTRRTASSQSRLQPKPWGDVDPVALGPSFRQHSELQSLVYVPPVKRRQLLRPNEYDEALDMSSVAYKRRRLLAILHCPIEATTATTVARVAAQEHAAVMRGFSVALHSLQADEAALRRRLDCAIRNERNRLPLKFLFELPGGVGYCRDRIQRAMALWLEEFEANQQRVAWTQWKAVVEGGRYLARKGAFVRQAALKRLRLAMEIMVKAFLHKGYVKWVVTTRLDLWYARDAAARTIQPFVRRHFALRRCLAMHDAGPVNGVLADMYLAPPRPHLPFVIPLRIRLERRQLWKAAISVQAPFRGRRFRKFMKRQRMAAVRIQALVRKRLAVAYYRHVRRLIVRLQAAMRRYLAQTRYLALRAATQLVQRNWRGRLGRKFVRLVILAERRHVEVVWAATVRLQRVARGFLGRGAARRQRSLDARCVWAALLIQKAWYRRNGEATTFFLLGCLREKDADERHEAARLHHLGRVQKARTLQRYFKAFIVARRHAAAAVVQRAFWGYVARCQLAHLKLARAMHRRIKWWFRVHHARRQRTATRLQYWWRKAVPGRLLRHLAAVAQRLRAAEARATRAQRDGAATTIQALVHGAWTRAFVAKTRAAIAIQRVARGRLARRRVALLLRARRQRIAAAYMAVVIPQAVASVTEATMRRRGRDATTIQRYWRGCSCRQYLVAGWANDARRQSMAVRLQRIWRQNAQKRFAARLLTIQRRRVANPYGAFDSIVAIVEHAVAASLAHFDPYDPLVGLGLAAWLRRLGLEGLLDDVTKLGFKSVAALRGISDAQLAVLVKDKERRQTLQAALHYHEWLADARSQRRLIADLQRAHHRLDVPFAKVVANAAHQNEVVATARERYAAVELEARDFQHPPRALRHRQDTCAHQLRLATEALAMTEAERDRHTPVVAAAKEALEVAKRALKPMEEREMKAVFLQRSCLFVDSPEHIRRIFLDYFPNMDARALSFVASLRGKPVTSCQLLMFFSQHSTISEVKLHAPALTYSKLDAEIAKAETVRLLACCDVMQFAVERVAELVAVSVVAMADVHAASPLPIAATVLDGTHRAHGAKLPHRPLVWRQTLQRLAAMHTSALAVQRLWRSRQGRALLKSLRLASLRRQLQASYEADRLRQNVRSVWEADTKAMQAVLADRRAADAHAALVEELAQTLRFGYDQDWHDAYQAWYYVHAATGTMSWERPSYGVAEHVAGLRLQRAARKFLGRRRRKRHRRAQLRAVKKERERAHWEPQWMDRQRSVTLRIVAVATANTVTLQWTRTLEPRSRQPSASNVAAPEARPRRQSVMSLATPESRSRRQSGSNFASPESRPRQPSARNLVSPAPLLEALYLVFGAAYHKSVLREATAHRLVPTYARPPNAHASAIIEMLRAYAALRAALAPDRATVVGIRFTKVEMPFGWQTVEDNNHVYYYNALTSGVTWDRPEYTFEHEYAARAIQAAYQMFLGRKAFLKLLHSFSFVEHVHATIAAGASIGHVGFHLEGMPLSVYLCRLGLAKHVSAFAKTKHTVASFWTIPEAKWLSLGVVWSKEERALLKQAPRPGAHTSRRRWPLTPPMTPVPEKHGFLCVPTEKALQSMLLTHFTGQQGRVLGLVRAVKELPLPVSTKQLDMYVRLYSGRPQQATENLRAEIIPAQGTTEEAEVELWKLFQTSLRRCAVIATNLRLKHLAGCLLDAVAIANCIRGVAHDPKLAVAAVPLTPAQLAKVLPLVPNTRGLWEHNITTDRKLSVGQAALYLRAAGLEFCLRYVRSAVQLQATYRMSRLHRWYRALVAHRNRCATTVQLAWACSKARAARTWLLAEQRSEYEEHYVEASGLFFYVYTPTQERLNRPPVDEYGRPLPFRPLVVDRISKKHVLSWPWLASSNQAPEAAAFESNVVCSVCKNERASRVCDVCCTAGGDYVYYCFACYCLGHPPALQWHSYQPLNHVHAAPLRCVECTRYSSHRCLACKEDYCDRCFARIHSKGSRARHVVERYPPQAAVCIECEERVAIRRCTVCEDDLCEDCADRTHARGNKAAHAMAPVVQLLPDGGVHCATCAARAADTLCRHCHRQVCFVCLAGRHAAACLETQLATAKAALHGDALCADCGKPADRACTSCGDKYCSARWMGNPGCFERFHAKGKRIEHEWAPLPPRPAVPATGSMIELERQIAAARKAVDDAAAAEARTHAELLAQQREDDVRRNRAQAAEEKRAKRAAATPGDNQSPPKEGGKRKPRALPCAVAGCAEPVFGAQIYCAAHCTVQLLLATGLDAAEVGKVVRFAQEELASRQTQPSRLGKLLRDLRGIGDMSKLHGKGD